MDAGATWRVRCATVMPDHIHLLMVLGARLSLGRALQRLKGVTASALRVGALVWERDFFDRHLRRDEDRLSLFLYIYLNPYRAGLLARTEHWPYYYCCDEDWRWFREQLDQDSPVPEWLM